MLRLLAGVLLLVASLAAAQQSNVSGVIFPLAPQTSTQSSIDQTNTFWRGAHVVINVTAYTSGNFTPKIQAKEILSGSYYDILSGPALSSTGITVLRVYPGIPAVVSSTASDMLPTTWRVQMVGASTPVATFSVIYFLGN